MKVVPNQFLDLYKRYDLAPAVINTTCRWNDLLLIGTDEGLRVIDDAGRLARPALGRHEQLLGLYGGRLRQRDPRPSGPRPSTCLCQIMDDPEAHNVLVVSSGGVLRHFYGTHESRAQATFTRNSNCMIYVYEIGRAHV